MLFDKLSTIINKYMYSCTKEISILGNDQDQTIDMLIKKYKSMKLRSEIDDLDQSCVIVLMYNKMNEFNHNVMKFVNEYVNKKKTIIAVVQLDFDFDSLVKQTKANSIDAINWKDKNGNKFENYIIVINKD